MDTIHTHTIQQWKKERSSDIGCRILSLKQLWSAHQVGGDRARTSQSHHQAQPLAAEVFGFCALNTSSTHSLVFDTCGSLPSCRLMKMSSVLRSWYAQNWSSLQLMQSGPAAFHTLLFLSWSLTWWFVRNRLVHRAVHTMWEEITFSPK